MSLQIHPTIIVTNIKNYLDNRYIRAKSYFVIDVNGNGYYLVKGERIPAKTFEDNYPIELVNIID